MEKNVGLSYCRVVATVFIVMCHIIKYYTTIPFSQYWGHFFNVGVEMFILISGYLYGEKKISDYKKFYLYRYLKICLPVQIWTVVMFICSGDGDVIPYLAYFFNIGGLGWIHKKLGFPAVVGSLGHTWFVTIIILCYLLIPFVQKICGRYKEEKIFCGLLLLWIITIIAALCGIQIYYFTLFLSAYYTAYYGIKTERLFGGGYWLYTLVTVALSAGRLFLRLDTKYALFYDGIYVHISHSLLATWMIVTICGLCKHWNNLAESMSKTWLHQWLERLSYPVYITHHCFIGITYGRYYIGIASVAFLLMTACTSLALYQADKVVKQRICKFL